MGAMTKRVNYLNRNRRLKAALTSVILQFEHPIAAFGSEFTPITIAQLSYPDLESILCVFDTLVRAPRLQSPEIDRVVRPSVAKSIVKQTNPNTSLTTLRRLARLTMRFGDFAEGFAYEEIIPALKYLIEQTDFEVLYYTTMAVDEFAFCGDKYKGLLIDGGILHHLIPLISHSHWYLQVKAIHAVSRFTAGTNEHRQAVWDSGFLNHYPNVLKDSDEIIREVVFLCLSHLAAGNRGLLCALIERGLFPQFDNQAVHECLPALAVDDLMKYDNCKVVLSEINWDLFSQLCICLDPDLLDVSVTLYSLSNILSKADGQQEEAKKRIEHVYGGVHFRTLEESQWSVNDDESRLSYHIMEDYFG
ncbi:unnamed protein product [Calicophoron daubneyi]|uniref:Uncharacterized protein n=1 Tax=Calicophoron daubneyi TaxID=300641 RepID=A0AAV2T417_CALDB